jgi:hypothetical protein
MAKKKFFFSLGTFSIKDESEIRFWEDRWLGGLELPHFVNNIQRCITLCDTKVILLLKFWRLPLQSVVQKRFVGSEAGILERLTSTFGKYPFTTWT